MNPISAQPDQLIFQWRDEPNQGRPNGDATCWHVRPHGRGYQIVNPEANRPIATIRAFEPMPGEIKYWGKLWEWNPISASYTVHNHEFSTAKNCRSYLNTWIKRLCGECEIIGGKRGRPAGATAKAVRNARDRKRRKDKLRAERFAHIETLVARAGETIPAGLTNAQVIDWILDKGLDE